jgi:hypothetical protein
MAVIGGPPAVRISGSVESIKEPVVIESIKEPVVIEKPVTVRCIKDPIAIIKNTANNLATSHDSFVATFGQAVKSERLDAFVCREGQTFNVYWLGVGEAVRYSVEVFKCIYDKWYPLTIVQTERHTHYVSLSGLVGEGFVFRVSAEDRNGEMLSRTDGIVMGKQTVF